jgi:hypothetical protein
MNSEKKDLLELLNNVESEFSRSEDLIPHLPYQILEFCWSEKGNNSNNNYPAQIQLALQPVYFNNTPVKLGKTIKYRLTKRYSTAARFEIIQKTCAGKLYVVLEKLEVIANLNAYKPTLKFLLGTADAEKYFYENFMNSHWKKGKYKCVCVCVCVCVCAQI